MAAVMPELRPATSCIQFSSRHGSRADEKSNGQLSKSMSHIETKPRSDPHKKTSPAVNPNLSVIELESLLREKVKKRHFDLQQGFQNYDTDQTQCVTKGEFRRVLESFCFPLTTEQCNTIFNKLETSGSGKVPYCKFLDQFYGGSRPSSSNHWNNGVHKYIKSKSPQEASPDVLDKNLRDKLKSNLKNVIKALGLYDYNRDGFVQRHELRKVLENYYMKLTDQQFDKFCMRYDFQHRGVINYKDFLERLGLSVERQRAPAPDNASGALMWKQSRDPGKDAAINSMAHMSTEQIDVEFRKKMKENYSNLKRIFLAFDKHQDGFVAIKDLKSILNHFTFPMSDSTFNDLMDRNGLKASGKISWEIFLEKYQDPQSHGNGQTVPIKPNHRFFPLRGSTEKMTLRDIMKLLESHVTNAYSSFKQAFLEIDKTHKGSISRKDLRTIIDNFKIVLSAGQFQELMILLDPQHTNFISYHKFLDLFEQKETKEGHKWLKSCHRYNDTQRPAVLAWETIEGIMRDKVTENWKQVADAVVRVDQQCTGFMPPKKLRKILEKLVVPVSDEHFENLVNRIEGRDATGNINYVELFEKLNIVIKPGDLDGLSSQIQDGNVAALEKIQEDQTERHQQSDFSAMDKVDRMSVDEILTRLRDSLAQQGRQISSVFHHYDKARNGKISRSDFRKLLGRFGIQLADPKFKEVCSELSFHNGYMTYIDFVNNFEDLRIGGGPSDDLRKSNNHRVNPIRGDEYGMTAEQVENKLRSKLRENFEDLRGAFYKFDDDHSGFLTKKNFRRMLDAFMFFISDTEFERLCQHMGVQKNSRISYQDFLNCFEVRDTVEGHKWLKSTHKFNDIQKMKLMSAESVHKVLADKVHQHWTDLAKAFRTMDSSGNGIITKRELRDTLYNFMLPMGKTEFTKLWTKYDLHKKGFVTHQDFLQHLTGDRFAPGDEAGTSKQILVNSNIALDEHHARQQAMHEQITYNQADRAEFFTVDQLLQQLKDRIRDHHPDFHTTFKKYDKRNKGYLSVTDIQKVLHDFNFFLDDDQLYDLLERLGLNGSNRKLTYEGFLKAFEEGRKDQYGKKEKEVALPQLDNAHLKPEQAAEKLRHKVAQQADILEAAFQAFDQQNAGRMPLSDFRRVLDNFCFMMTDAQFKHFSSSLTIHSGNMVDYPLFIGMFKENDHQKWQEMLDQHTPTQNEGTMQMTIGDVQQHMQDLVPARFFPLSKALAEVDYARIGVIAKEDFREIINKHIIRLNSEQFEQFWETLRVNEFGNLEYKDFLKRYGTGPDHDRPGSVPPTPLRRPATSGSDMYRPGTSYSMMSERMARPFTPLVNAEDAEKKLQGKIHKHWKDIQKQCRRCDPEDTGQLAQGEFKGIISRYGLQLSEDETRKLLLKYDLKNNGRFCYADFLRHFVLNMGSQSQNPLLGRKRTLPTKLENGHSLESQASARLRHCVHENWKDMRREFRSLDPNGIGSLSAHDFRQVLRNYSINMTEDEFFEHISPFDSSQIGQIKYGDFIKHYFK